MQKKKALRDGAQWAKEEHSRSAVEERRREAKEASPQEPGCMGWPAGILGLARPRTRRVAGASHSEIAVETQR